MFMMCVKKISIKRKKNQAFIKGKFIKKYAKYMVLPKQVLSLFKRNYHLKDDHINNISVET